MRVMTYNIRGGLGMDGRRDIVAHRRSRARLGSRTSSAFRKSTSASPWSGFADQPAACSNVLGMPFVFQANVNYAFGLGGYGLGIATAYPVLGVTPAAPAQPGRTARRPASGHGDALGALTVLNTHWGLKHGGTRPASGADSGNG